MTDTSSLNNHYWYLATPYAKYPGGKYQAYLEALRQTALLLSSGIPVFSPIVHNHPLSLLSCLEDKNESFDFWVRFVDGPMMYNAKGLIVCMMKSWRESVGIAYEEEFFDKMGKPVVYMTVDTKPDLPEVL